MKIKQLICVGIVGLAMCQAAFAGGSDVQDNTGPYVGLHGGAAIPGGSVFDDVVKTGPSIGAQAGYRMDSFRAELAATYYHNNNDVAGFGGHLNTFMAMINGYYDFDTGTIVTPYLGAGFGWAHFTESVDVANVTISGSTNEFAYQGIAGLDFAVAQNMTLGVRYRIVGWTTGNDWIGINSAHFNVVEAVFNYYL